MLSMHIEIRNRRIMKPPFASFWNNGKCSNPHLNYRSRQHAAKLPEIGKPLVFRNIHLISIITVQILFLSASRSSEFELVLPCEASNYCTHTFWARRAPPNLSSCFSAKPSFTVRWLLRRKHHVEFWSFQNNWSSFSSRLCFEDFRSFMMA